jgi:hypothetical protein
MSRQKVEFTGKIVPKFLQQAQRKFDAQEAAEKPYLVREEAPDRQEREDEKPVIVNEEEFKHELGGQHEEASTLDADGEVTEKDELLKERLLQTAQNRGKKKRTKPEVEVKPSEAKKPKTKEDKKGKKGKQNLSVLSFDVYGE